jgi:hypothetical protein
MDYIFIADEMLIEDEIDMYIEIMEICDEIDMMRGV